MTEYLDIIDESDSVVGKNTREFVHEHHLVHRGVHVLVINSKAEILVQVRSAKKKDRPGYLDASVGAQVQSGETYEQAARRETYEELGFTPGTLTLICKYNSFSERQREIRTLFVTVFDGPFRTDPNEVGSISFLSLVELEKKIADKTPVTDGFLLSLNHYRESIRH